MVIIGGIGSIILSYFISINAHPIVQIFLKILIITGGVLAIVGGAKAGSNPISNSALILTSKYS